MRPVSARRPSTRGSRTCTSPETRTSVNASRTQPDGSETREHDEYDRRKNAICAGDHSLHRPGGRDVSQTGPRKVERLREATREPRRAGGDGHGPVHPRTDPDPGPRTTDRGHLLRGQRCRGGGRDPDRSGSHPPRGKPAVGGPLVGQPHGVGGRGGGTAGGHRDARPGTRGRCTARTSAVCRRSRDREHHARTGHDPGAAVRCAR